MRGPLVVETYDLDLLQGAKGMDQMLAAAGTGAGQDFIPWWRECTSWRVVTVSPPQQCPN